MQTFRAVLSLRNGYIGNLHSDTVFGGLCWAVKSLAGDSGLNNLLQLCRNRKPPFVISDVFPGQYLPKPFLTSRQTLTGATQLARVLQAKKEKQNKERVWLSIDEFLRLAAGEHVDIAEKPPLIRTSVTLHNTIDRVSGATLIEGGLYDLPVSYCKEDVMTCYLKVAFGWEDLVRESLLLLGQFGVGKRRSIGKGGFTLERFEQVTIFDHMPDANAFISLSHFVPASDDPVIGNYKTMVTYPKLDREYANGNCQIHPFKFPLIQFLPGSVFFTGQPPKDFYGTAVTGIAPGLPTAIQGCFALAVPAKLTVESA